MDQNAGMEKAISIANNKHDLVALHIFDERETEIPNIGMIKLKDAETGEYIWVDTSSSSVRKSYIFHWQNARKENTNFDFNYVEIEIHFLLLHPTLLHKFRIGSAS